VESPPGVSARHFSLAFGPRAATLAGNIGRVKAHPTRATPN
jgi:hypothetical protein